LQQAQNTTACVDDSFPGYAEAGLLKLLLQGMLPLRGTLPPRSR